MPSANSQWRSYVKSAQGRRTNKVPKSGSIVSGPQAAVRIGRGPNGVAGFSIANATSQLRHQPGKISGSSGSVL